MRNSGKKAIRSSLPTGGTGSHKNGNLTEHYFKYISIMPALLILGLVSVYPLGYLLYLSFTDANAFNMVSGDFHYGTHNFVALFQDKIFIKSIVNTFYFTFASVLLQTVLGLILASLVYNMKTRTKNIIVMLLLLPTMIADVAIGLVWKSLLDVSTGIVNFLMNSVGLGSIAFLSDDKLAMLTIIAVDVWQWTPFVFLFILSGLESLNKSYFEVAKLEGCGPIRSLYHIVLPLLRPIILVAIFFRITTSLRVFDKVFILTGGGPGSTTETISTYIQRIGFSNLEFGIASAGGVIMMFLAFLVGMAMLRSMYKSV